jgi:organic radical activating enzyme
LADAVAKAWPADTERRYVVCTGGEPLLQLDTTLVDSIHRRGFSLAVETNGTCVPPEGVDWLTVSPKFGGSLAVAGGDELKLAFPQDGLDPRRFEELHFSHFFIQPIDGPRGAANVSAAVQFCLANPRWRLSIQAHKVVGLP